MTFLRNHRDVIAGMDFFVVPTVRFTLLYVWLPTGIKFEDRGIKILKCVPGEWRVFAVQ